MDLHVFFVLEINFVDSVLIVITKPVILYLNHYRRGVFTYDCYARLCNDWVATCVGFATILF